MRGMGEDIQSVFNQQILQYKQVLISLYKQKTKLSAEREALRFQYSSGFKSKVSNAAGRINTEMYSDNNPQGEELVRFIIGFLMGNIPMVALNGSKVQGWGDNVYMAGGRLSVGLLSPLPHIFVEPFQAIGQPDQRPAYQIYKDMWLGETQGPTWVTSYYYLGDWNQVNVDGVVHKLTIPLTEEYTASLLKQRGKAYLAWAFPYMNEMLSTDFGGGSFYQIILDGRTMFKKIMEQTVQLMRIQIQLDGAEADLQNFVDEFVAYSGQTIVLSEVLASIKAEADQPEVVHNEVPVGATVVENVVLPNIPAAQEEVIEPITPVVVEQKSSLKVPMMIAAAGAIFLATRK